MLIDPITVPREISAELDEGETVVWFGKPKPVFFKDLDIAGFIFMLVWTAFICFWILGAAGYFNEGHRFHGYFFLFGLPFLAIGLVGLFRPVWSRQKLKRTYYVISDRRAFSVIVGKKRVVTDHSPALWQTMIRRENTDGSGDLIFIRKGKSTTEDSSEGLKFYNIAEVKKVEKLLRSLAVAHRSADNF